MNWNREIIKMVNYTLKERLMGISIAVAIHLIIFLIVYLTHKY